MIAALFSRECASAWRQMADIAAPIVFALLVVCLFPFAFSPEPMVLRRFGFGMVVVACILAQFLGMEKIFRVDLEAGITEVVALSRLPLPVYALTKAIAHWLTHALPLLVASPVFLLMLDIGPRALPEALLALALLTLILSLLGTAGAALSLGARQPGLLLPLLLLPFSIPALVFAVGLAQNGLLTGEGMQSFLFLGALVFLYGAATPFLSSLALKAAIESQ